MSESKKYFILEVKGKNHTWCFNTIGHEEYWQDWIDDGLKIDLLVNEIPEWAVNMGLLRIWVFFQDIGFLKPR